MITIENCGYSLEELLPIVSEAAAKYGGYEHSSITYEKAQMLMEAVLYCINEYYSDSSHSLLAASVSAKEAYQRGQDIVIRKFKKLNLLYNTLITSFNDYGCSSLKNTITKGIPWFLSKYDFQYAPQETLLSPDYPVLKNLDALSGIHFILEYMDCIHLEQKFLKKFDAGYIIEILQLYHGNYQEPAENICEIVLQNTVGHIMLGKPLHSRGFDKEDLKAFEKLFEKKSSDEIQSYISRVLKQITESYYDNDILLLDYLSCSVPNIAARMQFSRKNLPKAVV